jgi:hypothetical protein
MSPYPLDTRQKPYEVSKGVTGGTITHALSVSTCGRANFHTGWVSVAVRHAFQANLTLAHRKPLLAATVALSLRRVLNHPDDPLVWRERLRVRMNHDLAPNCDGYVIACLRVFDLFTDRHLRCWLTAGYSLLLRS